MFLSMLEVERYEQLSCSMDLWIDGLIVISSWNVLRIYGRAYICEHWPATQCLMAGKIHARAGN